MTGLSFVGALDKLNEIQLKFVKEVLKKRGYVNGRVVAESVTKKGDNYMSCVLRLTVESTQCDVFKMIAKIAPQSPAAREMVGIATLFKNEHAMYAEILPKLTEQQEIADIPKNKRFTFPALYGSFLEAPNEIILLEDLKELNFVMLDRMQSLSNDSVKLTIKDLAKLHSLSHVLKHKSFETYNKLIRKVTNPWLKMDEDENGKNFYLQLEEDVLNILDRNEKYENLIKGSTSNMTKFAVQFNELDMKSKSSVIQQGDCWTNNIMFKLENGKPVECVLIDYQMSKVANPAQDLLYLILNCTDYKTKSKHYYQWIDCYHATLEEHLSYFDLTASRIYPRDQLYADLKSHGRYALAVALMMSNMLVRESEHTLDLTSDDDLLDGNIKEVGDKFRLIHLNKETTSRFKKKIEGLVDSIVEFGLI